MANLIELANKLEAAVASTSTANALLDALNAVALDIAFHLGATGYDRSPSEMVEVDLFFGQPGAAYALQHLVGVSTESPLDELVEAANEAAGLLRE